MSDIERINEIERAIAEGRMNAAQVFTQMRQLIPAARATDAKAVPVAWWDGDLKEISASFEVHQTAYHTIPVYTHPPAKTESQWIRCDKRLPTEADGDCNEHVWVYDKLLKKVFIALWADVEMVPEYAHWMPTGLKRPQPPTNQESGNE